MLPVGYRDEERSVGLEQTLCLFVLGFGGTVKFSMISRSVFNVGIGMRKIGTPPIFYFLRRACLRSCVSIEKERRSVTLFHGENFP